MPIKSRHGPQILSGLQEIITECQRLGYPVKVAHTDRAKELMSKATMDWLQSHLIQPSFTQGDDPKSNGLAERLVGWVKARARLHLAASGLGVERWPSAMEFACSEHRRRILQPESSLPRFGQKVVFKSKHPTGKSKRPFVRWEHGVYLHPSPRTDGGHVLLRALSGAFLVAKNIRCLDELFDAEAEFREEKLEADVQVPEAGEGTPKGPERRVTGKRAVRAVQLESEVIATELLKAQAFTADDCGKLLVSAFGRAAGGSRRLHRGPVQFSSILGAYCHGGLKGVTRASQVHPALCKYLNEYMRHNCPAGTQPEWTALMVMVADSVTVHRDVRNEPGSLNFVSHVTTRDLWVEGAHVGESSETALPVTQEGPRGGTLCGSTMTVGQGVVGFDPKRHHALLPATNWVIAGYSPLGSYGFEGTNATTLQTLGFRFPTQVRIPQVCKVVGPNPQMMQPARRTAPRVPRPGRAGMNVRYARMSGQEWEELCQLDEEQFEQRFERWQRVLGGTDEPDMNPLSAHIPQALLVATVMEQRDWDRDPVLLIRRDDGATIPVARVFQFSDDGYVDDMPFPDRMLMVSIHDYPRDRFEMVILRVELIEVPEEASPLPLADLEASPLQPPGPPPPEIRAIGVPPACEEVVNMRLPIPLPNPTCIKGKAQGEQLESAEVTEARINKAEATTTKDLEVILSSLQEPLCVTHTAAQEEVRAHLSRWKPSIEKELSTLIGPGVLVSHKGQDARDRLANPETTVIPLKGVFTAKPPSTPEDGFFRRKCRLVGCGNQTSHVDAERRSPGRAGEGRFDRGQQPPVVGIYHRHQVRVHTDSNPSPCGQEVSTATTEMVSRPRLSGGW